MMCHQISLPDMELSDWPINNHSWSDWYKVTYDTGQPTPFNMGTA
jgi:hypothetical protein